MEIFGVVIPMWTAILVGIITVLIVLYRRLTTKFGYWKSQGVMTDKAYPLIGTEYAMLKIPFHELDMARSKKYGRIYGMYFNKVPILNVADPDIIRCVLVKDFPYFVNRQCRCPQSSKTGMKTLDSGLTVLTNDDWKRVRSIISPTFTSGKIRKMAALVKENAERVTNNFMEAADKGEVVESKKFFTAFTMDSIGACAFGIDVDSLGNPDHPYVVNSKKMFNKGVTAFTILFILMPWLVKLGKHYFMRQVGFEYFADVAAEIIRARKENEENHKRVDFLQLMLDAREGKLDTKNEDEAADNDSHYTQTSVFDKPVTSSKTISENEILSNCVIFLLAGHETMATALNFVIYNLAMNPEVQEKLLHEIDQTWERNIDIDYDVVNKMTYLDAVISESLRMHAIAPRLVREANAEYTIPNTQIVIPKGGQVSIPVYALHHDPEFFPDPEKFDPERFMPENKRNIVPYSYLPFGDGPRNCIGMRFALMNIKLCLVHVLRRVKFIATEETKKPLEYVVGQGVLQPKKLVLKPEKRLQESAL